MFIVVDVITKNTTYKEFQSQWEEEKKTLSKRDIGFISGKDGFKNAIKGFLTSDYYKRGKLIEDGQLVLGYIFKSWFASPNDYSPYWVLFSPSPKVNENPKMLKDVANRLSCFKPLTGDKTSKKLSRILDGPLSDAQYFEIPESLTDGNLIYLSIVYLRPEWRDKIILGLNPFIANQGVSKEILYLPDQFWSDYFKQAYNNNELI